MKTESPRDSISLFPTPRISEGEYIEIAQQVSLILSKYTYHDVDHVKRMIQEAIKNKSPFSMIRLRDGEGRILAYPDLINRKELSRSLNVWFGHDGFSDDNVEQIKIRLIKSIQQADLVGIATPEMVKEILPYTILGYALTRFNLLATKESSITSATIHQLMQLKNIYADILSNLDFCGLVSSRNLSENLQKRFNIKEVKCWLVPGEHKYPGELNNRPHYPEIFYELIDNISVPYIGAVFLVGAGVLGKIYCDVIKSKGGIALDIGSILDAWAEVPSRAFIINHAKAYSLFN